MYKKLEEFHKLNIYPFHMPGHKRNEALLPSWIPVKQDITEIGGFDNLHHAEGILKKAQEKAAALYGVEKTFFSVNGSTAALLAAVSACIRPGGKILIARNCHKAVYHALYLRNLKPVYVYPEKGCRLSDGRSSENYGITGGISYEKIRLLLEEEADVQAVLITSPTYDGVVSDVGAIAEVCHRKGIPLIVDEAHGAHFAFSSYFPCSAASLGADIVVQSVHKTLPAMTQTALLHICSQRFVDPQRLARFMGMYQSSSPSYVLMAGTDACMALLEEHGGELFSAYTERLEKARTRLEACGCPELLTPVADRDAAVFDFDRSRLILSLQRYGISGTELFRLLREDYKIETEMDGIRYVLALSSVGDTEEGFDRLCSAAEDLRFRLRGREISGTEGGLELSGLYGRREQLLPVSKAMDAETEGLPLSQSAGHISAEFIYCYPPGIPVIVPGEMIPEELPELLESCVRQGVSLQGMEDHTAACIKTVRQDNG